jgi:hypothetical protein
LQINISQELTPQLSHEADTGVRDMLVTSRSVDVAFSCILGSAHPFDVSANGTPIVDIDNSAPKAMQLQVGSAFGNMFMMHIGKPLQYEVPQLTDMGGVFGLSMTLKPGNYTADANTVASDAADSDFRIAFL